MTADADLKNFGLIVKTMPEGCYTGLEEDGAGRLRVVGGQLAELAQRRSGPGLGRHPVRSARRPSLRGPPRARSLPALRSGAEPPLRMPLRPLGGSALGPLHSPRGVPRGL
jgi:hypothetical protein